MCLLYGCVCSGARVYQSVMKVGATYMDGQAGCNILCMIKLDYVDLQISMRQKRRFITKVNQSNHQAFAG